MISQGDIAWASLQEPVGSEPGFRRPVVVVQGDDLNITGIATLVVVPLTSNLRWAEAPGNVVLGRRQTGLPKDSVANVAQVGAVDRRQISDRVGHLPARLLQQVIAGIDVVLGR